MRPFNALRYPLAYLFFLTLSLDIVKALFTQSIPNPRGGKPLLIRSAF
jgi:hypothetical protein